MHHIFHDIYIEASAEQVFSAISLPGHLVNWWPLRCSGEPVVGSNYNFFFNEDYNWWGEVIESKSCKSFHIKMTDADEDWNPTTLGFDIQEESKAIWLQFWHRNWPTLNHHFRRSSWCWAILLNGLKNYIEKGKIIPFSERA